MSFQALISFCDLSDEDEGDEQAHCGRGGPDGGLQHDHFQQWIDDGVPDDPGDLIPEDG